MKILQSLAGLNNSAGGSRHATTTLCEALGRHGVTVFLVSQDDAPAHDPCILPDRRYVETHMLDLTIKLNGLKLNYSFQFAETLNKICKQNKIQILHDNGLWLPCNHSAASIAGRYGIPLVIHPHGMLERNALEVHSWKKSLAWRLYQRKDLEIATMFVATSESEAKSIRAIGFDQPIAVIPIGVDIPDIGTKTRPNKMRQAVFLSRIHPIKGLTDLVEAWAKVQPTNWKMVIAGPDEENHRSEIERAVANRGLTDSFVFVGPAYGKFKEDLFKQSDLFILPSKSENFGLVVAEALSYGIPVLTTDRTPWKSLVSHQCGWWVEKSVDALAEAISNATSLTDAERETMGSRGRGFVEKEFSWSKVANKMIMAYEWVLGISPRPEFIM